MPECQYTRIYRDKDGRVRHVHTQDCPIEIEPVDDEKDTEYEDLVIEKPDGCERHIRAIEVIKSIEDTGTELVVSHNAADDLKQCVIRDLTAEEDAATMREHKIKRKRKFRRTEK